MKNRNLIHVDNWGTPDYFMQGIYNEFGGAVFDPCPLGHDTKRWDGLEVEWHHTNFINPPYSRKLKGAFVIKAIQESKKGKLCVMLLPVSTSTQLFHRHILPNATEVRFIEKRIKFIGINTKGERVNFHLIGEKTDVKNSGMHDSMLVIFDGRKQ